MLTGVQKNAHPEPGLEWLEALGDPAMVGRELSALGLEPASEKTLSSQAVGRPIGSWFSDLILEIFDAHGVDHMGLRDLRDALLNHGRGQVGKELLTAHNLELLLRRAEVRPVLAFERGSFHR